MFVIHLMMARGPKHVVRKVSEEYLENKKTQCCDSRYKTYCHIYIVNLFYITSWHADYLGPINSSLQVSQSSGHLKQFI
jgi:hypothetical protein